MEKQSDNRNRLLVLYECGFKSAKKLHRLTAIPLSTIYDHLKRFQIGEGKARKECNNCYYSVTMVVSSIYNII